MLNALVVVVVDEREKADKAKNRKSLKLERVDEIVCVRNISKKLTLWDVRWALWVNASLVVMGENSPTYLMTSLFYLWHELFEWSWNPFDEAGTLWMIVHIHTKMTLKSLEPLRWRLYYLNHSNICFLKALRVHISCYVMSMNFARMKLFCARAPHRRLLCSYIRAQLPTRAYTSWYIYFIQLIEHAWSFLFHTPFHQCHQAFHPEKAKHNGRPFRHIGGRPFQSKAKPLGIIGGLEMADEQRLVDKAKISPHFLKSKSS